MKIIGLTGGIGAGKSTVSHYLLQKNIPVIDADRIARQIVQTGTTTLKKLEAVFGNSIILSSGELDRKALAGIVFNDENRKKQLDLITHGDIVEIINKKISEYENLKVPLIFIDAPLLIESGLYNVCSEVWVVDAEDNVRLERVEKRDMSKRDEILARMNNQLTREKRNAYATAILNNSGDKEELYLIIDELLKKYA